MIDILPSPAPRPDSDDTPHRSRERTPRRRNQAKQEVLNYIRINRLDSGSRLPTEEALCQNFGWSRTTIVRALNELAAEGIVNRVQGSGTYVALADPKRTLRIMVSSHPQGDDDDDYCTPLLAGLLSEAATHGVDLAYHPATVPTIEDLEREKVDGVVAVSWRVDDLPRVLAVHEAGIPIVGLALRSRTHQLPLICTDNFGGMRQAIEHLLAHGHRSIAYNCANLANSDNLERLLGFQYAMAQAGLVFDPSYLEVLVSNRGQEVATVTKWWESMNPKPTAVVMDALDAPAVLAALARQRVRIPEDVSVVVLDERSALRHHFPPLTFVRQPVQELGRRGMAKLMAMIRGEDDGNPEILPAELIARDSVRTLSGNESR